MYGKRRRLDADDANHSLENVPPLAIKRPRLTAPSTTAFSRPAPPRTGADLISALSDELLVRILSFLPLPNLLALAPVSYRFYRLAADSQIWKRLYYTRFVLPRAMRIPGFRDASASSTTAGERNHKLHYSGRRTLWADGRRGGVVRDTERSGTALNENKVVKQDVGTDRLDWKRQYKIRHNWARGKCAVEELKLGIDAETGPDNDAGKLLVKLVEGIAITADKASGLRCWDVKTRDLLAYTSLEHVEEEEDDTPTCMAVDDQGFGEKTLDIAVGFSDGSFGIWQLHLSDKKVIRRCRHGKSSNGELIAMAYSYPYLLTATESVLISLYSLEGPATDPATSTKPAVEKGCGPKGLRRAARRSVAEIDHGQPQASRDIAPTPHQHISKPLGASLPPPYLLTSLRSHTSRPPLALSIRKLVSTTIASIAYTFSTRQGWSIGMQDLHIQASATVLKATPEITTTRLAYTNPVSSGRPPADAESSAHTTPPRRRVGFSNADSSPAAAGSLSPSSPAWSSEPGPTTLCYTHPYLLATLPDNTLVLHLCTSNSSTLSLSPGIRLWGHTSGISDAEITARGKAVSVSSRGEEMRVWELEGRSATFHGRSVEIRPSATGDVSAASQDSRDWDERRNWVGFDDEMVIVLKETRGRRESLMVYDFT